MLSRNEELRRRVESLPSELQQWRQQSERVLDLNAHFSKLQALGILMDAFVQHQRELLNALQPQGDQEVFRGQAYHLIQEIIKMQNVWDFFRSECSPG